LHVPRRSRACSNLASPLNHAQFVGVPIQREHEQFIQPANVKATGWSHEEAGGTGAGPGAGPRAAGETCQEGRAAGASACRRRGKPGRGGQGGGPVRGCHGRPCGRSPDLVVGGSHATSTRRSLRSFEHTRGGVPDVRGLEGVIGKPLLSSVSSLGWRIIQLLNPRAKSSAWYRSLHFLVWLVAVVSCFCAVLPSSSLTRKNKAISHLDRSFWRAISKPQ